MARCRRSYLDAADGQLHLRRWPADQDRGRPPLLCLHPTPFSGLFFEPLAPLLAAQRVVVAPDYPGYGGSEPPPRAPSIGDYAAAMATVIDALDADRPWDLFGFHSGCLVAAELALSRADRVRRVVLLDVPCFDAQTRAEKRAAWAVPPAYGADPACLAPAWTRNVARKLEHAPLARGLALFAEELRAGVNAHWGFRAAFDYPCEERLAALRRPACVLASGYTLLEPSRAAAALIPGARRVELTDLAEPVLDRGATRIAVETLAFLDRGDGAAPRASRPTDAEPAA